LVDAVYDGIVVRIARRDGHGVTVRFPGTRHQKRVQHCVLRLFQMREPKYCFGLGPSRYLHSTRHTRGLLRRAFSMAGSTTDAAHLRTAIWQSARVGLYYCQLLWERAPDFPWLAPPQKECTLRSPSTKKASSAWRFRAVRASSSRAQAKKPAPGRPCSGPQRLKSRGGHPVLRRPRTQPVEPQGPRVLNSVGVLLSESFDVLFRCPAMGTTVVLSR
jgi:hypothetical protein